MCLLIRLEDENEDEDFVEEETYSNITKVKNQLKKRIICFLINSREYLHLKTVNKILVFFVLIL